MATVRLFLDKRTPNIQGLLPIRLQFNSNGETAYYSFNMFVAAENWDKTNSIVLPEDRKFKLKNRVLHDILENAEDFLSKNRHIRDAKKLRDSFASKDKAPKTFNEVFELFRDTKKGQTNYLYTATLDRITDFNSRELLFEDISLAWLTKFDNYLSERGNRTNSKAIHFRNIRSVFNYAIDNDIISADLYPFRKFKIKKEQTAKRSLPLNVLKRLLKYEGSDQQNWARDVFLLSFYLIGINSKDLFENPSITDDVLIYNRAKTKRLYEIKIEPEAKQLIEKFKGEKHTFVFCEQFQHNHSFYVKANDYLKEIATELKVQPFTLYAARHSWATVASELEIPKETISAAMGHASTGVTDVYINFNRKKVDRANRKVIDFLHKRYRNIKPFHWLHKKSTG